MKIHGLQKMTLLDFPSRVACTVFLGGCDFRCPFCHNFDLADGTAKPVMDSEEVLSFLRNRRGMLDGVALTGGEPCLHEELAPFLRQIRTLGYATKLDTNGYHPQLLAALLDEGLIDYVAMDIKNSRSKYAQSCGVEHVDMGVIEKSIALIREKAPDYEFRTTVVKELHELSDIEEIAQSIAGAKRYFLQAFADRDSVPFEGFSAPTQEEMQAFLCAAKCHVPAAQTRGV